MNYVDPAFMCTPPESLPETAGESISSEAEALCRMLMFGHEGVSGDFLTMAADSPDKPSAAPYDWAKLLGGMYGHLAPSSPPEPPKPEDPRSGVLGRALSADKPLDGYGRKP